MNTRIQLVKDNKIIQFKTPVDYNSLANLCQKQYQLPDDFLTSYYILSKDFSGVEQKIMNERDYQNYVIGQQGIKISIAKISLNNSRKENFMDISNSINSREDNQEIGRVFNEKISQLNLLLNELDKKDRDQDRYLNEIKQMVQQLNSSKPKAQSNVIHQNIQCSKCSMFPIRGRRYKCSICSNLNYCSDCRDRVEHEHEFVILTKVKTKCSGKPVQKKIIFKYPDLQNNNSSIYNLELINNGDIPWPKSTILECLAETEVDFEVKTQKIGLIEPNSIATYQLVFNDLTHFDDGDFIIKAQLKAEGKPISDIIEILLQINQNNDIEEEEDEKHEEFNNNPMHKKSYVNQREKSDIHPQDYEFMNENKESRFNNNNENGSIKEQDLRGYNNNSNNQFSGSSSTNQKQNRDFGNYQRPWYQDTPTGESNIKERNEFETRNQPQQQSQNNFHNNANQFQNKQTDFSNKKQDKYEDDDDDDDEDNNEFKSFRKDDENIKKIEKPNIPSQNDNEKKILAIYQELSKYSFEPIIPKKLIEETIESCNYDLSKTIEHLWDLYDKLESN